MKTRYAFLAAVSALGIAPCTSDAQTRPTWDVGLQVMSTTSGSTPDLFFGGQAIGIRQRALGIKASTDLLRAGPLHLRYSAQLLPAVFLTGVEHYRSLAFGDQPVYVIGGTGAAYGVGFSPIGLDAAVDLGHRVRAQVGAAAGILRFSQHIPTAAGNRTNFSAEWESMLLFNAGADRWLHLGLRWKHISNGFTAFENPGFDNRMIVAGFSTRIGRTR